jgi:ATP-dependent Clp protease protease subunit
MIKTLSRKNSLGRLEDDLEELSGSKSEKKFYVRSLAQEYSFYLTGEIEDPQSYTDWFQIMRSAGPDDIVKIFINSRGGSAATAIQFLRAMAESAARVHVVVEGECMSAATFIFLSADSIAISDHSSFMFHNYSGGVMGKGGEIYDAAAHGKAWSEKFLRSIYKNFLTDSELKDIFASRDIYMDKDEVLKRIDGMAKKKALASRPKKM